MVYIDRLTFLTFNLRISGISGRTVAKWLVVDDRALGVDAALARVDAEGVVAGLVEGTLFVSLTAHLDGGRWREEKNHC